MQKSRRPLAVALLSVSLLLVAWRAAPSLQPQDVEFEATNVAGPVHMITGQGGNLGVSVGPDGLLLIDDQFLQLAAGIQAELDVLAEAAGREEGAPRFLINTHHHGDHTGGNPFFGRTATIMAHANVRARLIGDGSSAGMAAEGLPILTYAEGLSVHFNGEEVRLVHLPAGHTDGDTVVHFSGSNVVHLGDLGFIGRFPYIDTGGGGSLAGFTANLERVLAMTDAETRFIPGHGPLAARADVEALHAMLVDVTGIVRAALDAGRTAEEMKADRLLAKYEDWNWNFITAERLIDTVVGELSGG